MLNFYIYRKHLLSFCPEATNGTEDETEEAAVRNDPGLRSEKFIRKVKAEQWNKKGAAW